MTTLKVDETGGGSEPASGSGTGHAGQASTPRPSSTAEMDRALEVLTNHKTAWAAMEVGGRIELLDRMRRDIHSIEQRWVAAGLAAKNAQPRTMAEGEEWYSVTVLYRTLRLLKRALEEIARSGRPKIPGPVTKRSDGKLTARVVPGDWKDRMALLGMRADVWLDDDAAGGSQGIEQAAFYHAAESAGSLCVVLGAGNVAGLVPGDFLCKLFVEGQVVALKMNPVNAYLGPLFEVGFRSLIDAGFLQILYGGAEEGAYLARNRLVDSLHMTGSDRTYEAIVFGTGPDGAERKRTRKPLLSIPFSAELGNISPVIVVPGQWSTRDVQRQAARLGSWLVPNSSSNCLTPRLIVQQAGWKERAELNAGIARYLDAMPTRKAYYPGAVDVHKAFVDAHPEAQQLGKPRPGDLPWTFIEGVDPTNADDICFRREPFCSLFSETALESDGVVDFLQKAVEFVNDRVSGTLVVSIVVHPASLRDQAVRNALNQAIEGLRYGSVAINSWGVLPHYLSSTPWGGYPGHDAYDIQSGIGFVNNPMMFERVVKSVVWAPFQPLADPFLAAPSNNYLYYRQDTRYQDNPSMLNLLKLVWRAMTIRPERRNQP